MQAFFLVSFFLRQRRKYTREKPRRNSVNENSSKLRRNTSPEERWNNYAKSRQSQSYTLIGKVEMISNTQNSIITNTEKDLKISKNRFNRYGRQVGSRASEKIYRPSGMWNNLISDSLNVGLHLSNITEARNFRTSRKYDLRHGPI